LNPSYPSVIVHPCLALWLDLGSWIWKLVNRRDMRLVAIDEANIMNQTAINLQNVQKLYDYLELTSNTTNETAANACLADVENKIESRNQNVTSRMNYTITAWGVDNQINAVWISKEQTDLNNIQTLREQAENSSEVSSLLTAQTVLNLLKISNPHYCEAATRLKNRLALMALISIIIEDNHILLLLNTYKDLVTLSKDQMDCSNNSNCTWNATLAAQYKQAFEERKIFAWKLIDDVEAFYACIDVIGLKIVALVTLKCQYELDVLSGLVAIVQQLLNGIKTDLKALRNQCQNSTKFYFLTDMFMDYANEIQDIAGNVTNPDSTDNFVGFLFRIIYNLLYPDDTLLIVATRFCRSINTYLQALFGLDVKIFLCDPTTAQSYVASKRQLGLSTNPANDEFTISTQASPSSSSSDADLIKVAVSALMAGVVAIMLL